jgi:serine/threonine protein kinase
MIGTQLSNYWIQAKLGEGGMGVVYQAVDLSLDRPVAIKMLPSELARDPGLVERFRAEAKALANLNHVNIATIYNFFSDNGKYVIVMEYLEGCDFEQVIRQRGRIPCEEAIRVFKQALMGIGFAHRRGIIHRDIKPGNIMLTHSGIVKVMDFGIAKALGRHRLTRTGTKMGTLAYMSPEQIRNDRVDARSDIYSLSATLYEMLSGRVPFLCTNEFDLMSAQLNAVPPSLRPHCPEVPIAVEKAVFRGLEKNPAARFQTTEEFGAALEHPQRRVLWEPAVAGTFGKKRESSPPLAQSQSLPKPVVSPVPPAPKIISPPPFPLPPKRVSPVPAEIPTPPPDRPLLSGHRAFFTLSCGAFLLLGFFLMVCRTESVPWLIAGIIYAYFLPTLLVASLPRHNGLTILKLNAAWGWTGIGWIRAMRQVLTDR